MGNLTKYCILLYWPDSTIIASQWFPTVLAIIFLLCGGLFNVYLTRKFAILECIMLTIHWAAWIAIVVTLWVTSPRGKASEVLFTFTNSGGWRSGGVATLAGTWLVVPDNPDDVGFLLEPPATMSEAQPTQRRIDYVPTCDHRAVIITTRSKRKALRLVYESEMVDVLPMGEGEAETLLESKLGRSSRDTRELVWALDCMPLTISQAAAYIRGLTSRCSSTAVSRGDGAKPLITDEPPAARGTTSKSRCGGH
ncbi:hypothetical protein LTR82_018300 [Friedmanniomyces endolithicus]|uniref:Uncharacterized protein n=1 Tax=Friedmanniomyces endolithicus TaxID=329885 RepID=A0AAN6F340_9PEZI|nr:hypothetical protein LTR82_018300 [Friedmanniomyces endolithicus]